MCETAETYKGRGVLVPGGLSAAEIMEGAAVLMKDYDVPPYTARNMVAAVLTRLIELGLCDSRLFRETGSPEA